MTRTVMAMTVLRPTTAAEVLAIVLSPARAFGVEPGTEKALRKIKAAVIRRYEKARRS